MTSSVTLMYEVAECVEYRDANGDLHCQAIYLAGEVDKVVAQFHTLYVRNQDGTAEAVEDGELECLLSHALSKQGAVVTFISNAGARYLMVPAA